METVLLKTMCWQKERTWYEPTYGRNQQNLCQIGKHVLATGYQINADTAKSNTRGKQKYDWEKGSFACIHTEIKGMEQNEMKWNDPPASTSNCHTLCLEGIYQKPIPSRLEPHVTAHRFILIIYLFWFHIFFKKRLLSQTVSALGKHLKYSIYYIKVNSKAEANLTKHSLLGENTKQKTPSPSNPHLHLLQILIYKDVSCIPFWKSVTSGLFGTRAEEVTSVVQDLHGEHSVKNNPLYGNLNVSMIALVLWHRESTVT